jgi:hypothetical protein
MAGGVVMFGLSSLATKAIVAAALLGLAFAGGVRMESKIAAGRYERLVASYAQAQAQALQAALDEQKRLDAIAQKAAEDEAIHQQKLATATRHQLAQVQKHVTALSHCLPYGVVRVLVAASGGRLPDGLSLPAGKSDSTCAPARWAEFLQGVVQDYGTARANAEQLDALSKFYRDTRK